MRELPKRIHLKDGRYYHVMWRAGKAKWTSLTKDLASSIVMARDLETLQIGTRDTLALRRYLGRCLITTKRRAIERAIPYDIDRAYVLQLAEGQAWRCGLTKLHLVVPPRNGRAAAMAPSIDRIVPARGYVRGNIRVLCLAMNYALNEFGEEFFEHLARAFIQQREAKSVEVSTQFLGT